MLRIAIALACAALIALGLASTATAQPKAGAKCGKSVKVGKVVVRKGVRLRCTRTASGKVWRRVGVAPKPSPSPAPGPSPSPDATPAPTQDGGLKLGSWTCNPGTANQFQFIVESASTYRVPSGSSGTYAFTGPATYVVGGRAMTFTGPYSWIAAFELDSSNIRLGMSPNPPTGPASFSTVCLPTS